MSGQAPTCAKVHESMQQAALGTPEEDMLHHSFTQRALLLVLEGSKISPYLLTSGLDEELMDPWHWSAARAQRDSSNSSCLELFPFDIGFQSWITISRIRRL
jgi:hypothetical protein